MNHFTLPSFWQSYHQLPSQIQHLADKNYALLRDDRFIRHCISKKLASRSSFGRCVWANIIAHLAWTKAKALSGFGLARTLNMTTC
jgi:hypothetical protein